MIKYESSQLKYQSHSLTIKKTQPRKIPIGEGRKIEQDSNYENSTSIVLNVK